MDFFLYLIIFFVSIIQSIAGVGTLVLGTPIMLILNYSILQTMFFLLPISIIISFSNLILINPHIKMKKKIDLKLIKYFFIFCFPSVCIGLMIMKNFNELINFNLLVSVIVFFSIVVKNRYEKFFLNLKKNSKKVIIFFIGLVHGLTNSGGTLLSLFIIRKDKKEINISRIKIHLFYFFLALMQLSVLYFFSGDEFKHNINLYLVFLIIIVSCLIGNRFVKMFKNLSSYLIYILAIISSIILFIKGIL
jgi:uncharacterized membrane protein YfcA